jgi:hypothetical protein
MNTHLRKTETTPARISNEITEFAAQLDGCTSPEWVPVMPLPDGEVGWCHRNVAKATSDEVERMLVPHPNGRWCAEPERYASLQKRRLAELRQMEALAWQTFRSTSPAEQRVVPSKSIEAIARAHLAI